MKLTKKIGFFWPAFVALLASLIFNIQVRSLIWEKTNLNVQEKIAVQTQTAIQQFSPYSHYGDKLAKEAISYIRRLSKNIFGPSPLPLHQLRNCQLSYLVWLLERVKDDTATQKWLTVVREWDALRKSKPEKEVRAFFEDTYMLSHEAFLKELDDSYVDELFSVYRSFPKDANKLLAEFIDRKMEFWLLCDQFRGKNWQTRSAEMLSAFREFQSPKFRETFLAELKQVSDDIQFQKEGVTVGFVEKSKEWMKEKFPIIRTLFLVNFSEKTLGNLTDEEVSRFDRLIESIELKKVEVFERGLKQWERKSEAEKKQFFSDFGNFLKDFQKSREATFAQAKTAVQTVIRGDTTDYEGGGDRLLFVKLGHFPEIFRDAVHYSPFGILLPRYLTLKDGGRDYCQSGWSTDPRFSGDSWKSSWGFFLQVLIFLGIQGLVYGFLAVILNRIDSWQAVYQGRKRRGPVGIRLAQWLNQHWETFQSCYFRSGMLAFNCFLVWWVYVYAYHL